MRNYRRKFNWVNNTGYTDRTPTNQNNTNTIPTNQITMSNTSQPLRAQGVDPNGYPMTEEMVLQPGQDYNFNNSFAVVEAPMFQSGGNYRFSQVDGQWYDNQTNQFVDVRDIAGLSRQQNISDRFTPPTASPTFTSQIPYTTSQPTALTPTGSFGNFYNQTQPTFQPQFSRRPSEYPIELISSTPTSTIELTDEQLADDTAIADQATQLNALGGVDLSAGISNPSLITPTAGEFNITGVPENLTTQVGAQTDQNELEKRRQQNERFQFYNPYTGMNLEQSSYLLGNAIGSGDTGGAVLAGARLGLGAVRNVFSGLGFANRNRQVQTDYAQQQRDAMTQANRPQFLQEGGQVQQEDPITIVAGLLSEGASPEEVFQMLVGEGISEAEAQAIIQQASNIFQEGGQYLEFAGRTQQEMPGTYNAELENNEWLLDSQGLRQVKGEDHENGGVKLELEEGTQIISNHLKIGDKDLIKELNKEYKVKITPKDTYAKALEKIYNKTGLNALMEEHAKLIKKTEKQENVKDDNTLQANVQSLTERMHKVELEKQPLQAKAVGAFNKLFTAQELEKETQGRSEKYQDGGIVDRLRTTAPTYDELQRNMILGRYQAHQTPETVEQLQQLLDSGRLVFNQGVLDRLASGENLGLPTLIQHQDETGTYGEMDDLRRSGYVYNDAYRNLYGSDLNYGDPVIMDEWNPRIRQGLSELGVNYRTTVQGNQENAFGTITAEQPGIIAEVQGNIDGNFDVNAYRQLTDEEKAVFAEESGVNKDELDNLVSNPAIVQFRTTPKAPAIDGITEYTPESTAQTSIEESQSTSGDEATETSTRRTGLLPMAGTSQLPPSAQQAHLKTNRRYERADFVGISPEQQLTELNRLTARATANLDNLPASQRAGAEANILATQAQQTAQILNQTQQYNTQEFNRIQNVNNQIQMQEENAGAQDALNYEQRQFLAQAKTDADFRNFYNAVQRQQQQNFDDVRDINKLNYMYPDFQLTDQGYEGVGQRTFQVNGQTYTQQQLDEMARRQNSNRKFGGRFKK